MSEAFIERADLVAAIDRLKLAKGPNGWTASFSADDRVLAATAAGNAAVEVSAALAHPADENFRFTVALPELEKWLKSVTGEMCVSLNENVVTFSTPDAELPIPETHDLFAYVPEEPHEKFLLPQGVWHALTTVAWAVNPKDTTTFGGMLHIGDGCVWATDRYRAAVVEIDELDADSSFWPGLAGALDFLDPGSMDARIDGRGFLHLSDEMGRFVVPPFVGQKPTAAAMKKMALRDPDSKSISVERPALEKALTALSGLQANDSLAVWLSLGSRLTLTVITGDSTPTTRQLDYEGDGPDIAFKLDALLPAVKSMMSDEITLEITDSKSHARMREGSYCAVLAPNAEGAPARRGGKR